MVYTVKNVPVKPAERTWIMCFGILFVLGSYLNLMVILTMDLSYMLNPHSKFAKTDLVPDWYDPLGDDDCDPTADIKILYKTAPTCMRRHRELTSLSITYNQEYVDEKTIVSPDFIVAMKNQLYYLMAPSVYPEDVDAFAVKSTKPKEQLIVRLGTVIQPGIVYITIRFKKPYVWGRLSPQMALNNLMRISQLTGARIFEPWVWEREHGGGLGKPDITGIGYVDKFPEGYKTFDMSVGNPYKHGKDMGVTEGVSDGRPTSRGVTEWALYIVYWTVGVQFVVAATMCHWGWEHQCEHHGDIRLTLKQNDDMQFRQEWPWFMVLVLTIFRLDIVPEWMEVSKCNKEFFGFTLLFLTNTTFQVIPCLIVQLYVGCGSGMGFSQPNLFAAVVVNFLLVAATGVLWERSQAFAVKRIAIDLSYLTNFSVQVRVVPMLGAYRILEALCRVLPLVLIMIVYEEVYLFYILALDLVLIFLAMVWTVLLQGGHLGGDHLRCTCNSLFAFLGRFVFVAPVLVFFYLDTLTGRTRHNTYVNPVLYYRVKPSSTALRSNVRRRWQSFDDSDEGMRQKVSPNVGSRNVKLVMIWTSSFRARRRNSTFVVGTSAQAASVCAAARASDPISSTASRSSSRLARLAVHLSRLLSSMTIDRLFLIATAESSLFSIISPSFASSRANVLSSLAEGKNKTNKTNKKKSVHWTTKQM